MNKLFRFSSALARSFIKLFPSVVDESVKVAGDFEGCGDVEKVVKRK